MNENFGKKLFKLAFGENHEASLRAEREAMLNEVAGTSHVSWRAEWKEHNNDKPREKPFAKENEPLYREDKKWLDARLKFERTHPREKTALVSAGENAYKVDIAALEFADMPPSRKFDSVESATVALDEVIDAKRRGQSFDDAFMEEASAKVHARWMRNHMDDLPLAVEEGRTEDAEKLKNQLVSYVDLTEKEKEKDREYVRNAIATYTTHREKKVKKSDEADINAGRMTAAALVMGGIVAGTETNQEPPPAESARPDFEEPTIRHTLTSEPANAERGDGAIKLLENFFERFAMHEELRANYDALFPGVGLEPNARAHEAAKAFWLWRPNNGTEAIIGDGTFLSFDSEQGLVITDRFGRSELLMLPNGVSFPYPGKMQPERSPS